MSEYLQVEAETEMRERLAEFDPNGDLASGARELWEILGQDSSQIARSFVDCYLQRSGLDKKLSATAVQALRVESERYNLEKLTNFQSFAWMKSLIACAREARKQSISIRSVLLAMNKSTEIVSRLVQDKTRDDSKTCLRLLNVIVKISAVEIELVCSMLAGDVAREERVERDRIADLFQQQIASQIDGASNLGEDLREQAKNASAATRGMLDKVSEVAAAAEQSALAMREAAHISAGLIRAIEDTRTEVESTADVAQRASAQAVDAVAMSVTLSDHAQAIESILGLIRDIAGQTYLLALNATIEAARA